MAELAIISAIAGLASSGISAYGTLAGGGAEASSAMQSARAQALMARKTGNAEARMALSSSTAQGVQAIMGAVAETQGLLDMQPLVKLRGETEKLGATVRAQAMETEAKEELAQSSVNMLQARRFKGLAHAKLTNVAAASGFTATDPTALRIGDEIERYGSVQEGMEIYGGLARSDSLRASAAAKRHYGASVGLASLMEQDAMRRAGLSILDAGRYSSKLATSTGKMVAANARATGGLSATNALRTGSATAGAARTSSMWNAGGTLLSGVSTFAGKFDKEWFK